MRKENMDRLTRILEKLNKTTEAEEERVIGFAEGLLAAQDSQEEKKKKKGVWK